MKQKYRGFEIEVKREKCLAGWSMLYFTVIRDDGYFLIDSFSDSNDTVRDMMRDLKKKVDDYCEHPEDYQEDELTLSG